MVLIVDVRSQGTVGVATGRIVVGVATGRMVVGARNRARGAPMVRDVAADGRMSAQVAPAGIVVGVAIAGLVAMGDRVPTGAEAMAVGAATTGATIVIREDSADAGTVRGSSGTARIASGSRARISVVPVAGTARATVATEDRVSGSPRSQRRSPVTSWTGPSGRSCGR